MLKVCSHFHQPVQLAIMDVALAATGPDLVEHLYSTYPDIRILYTSSNDESGAVRQIGRSGKVREFLLKPFRRSQLLGRVLEVLDAPLVTTA